MPNTRDTPWHNWQNEEVEGAPPVAVKPLVEHYQGHVFPYRGTETHGVDPNFDIPPSPDEWEGGFVPVETEPVTKDKPMRVTVVRQGDDEILKLRIMQTQVGANPRLILGQMKERQTTRIKNAGAVTIWIGANESVNKNVNAYPLAAGVEFVTNATTSIWGVSDDGTEVIVCIAIDTIIHTP